MEMMEMIDMSIEDYHAHEAISNSGLNSFKKAPFKYYDEYICGNRSEETQSMKVGKLIHTLTFERQFINDRYTIIPPYMNIRQNSGEGKKNFLILSSRGLPLIKLDELNTGYEIADQILKTKITENTTFKDILDKGGQIEKSAFWEENEVKVKSRPDFFNDHIIIDLKSSVSAEAYDFSCHIGKYGYHRQAYLQMRGLEVITGKKYKHFINIVVEKKPPYLTAAYRLDEPSIQKGEEEVQELLERFKYCKEKNEWPGYQPSGVQEISLTSWYRG